MSQDNPMFQSSGETFEVGPEESEELSRLKNGLFLGPGIGDDPQPSHKTNLLTVVSHVYHQDRIEGEGPSEITTRWDYELVSEEQPWIRRTKVTEEWKLLDSGWLEAASQLIIYNREGEYESVPTAEQKEEDSKKVIEVGIDPSYKHPPLWEIPPQQDGRIRPFNIKHLFIRCRHGQARCTIYIIPE